MTITKEISEKDWTVEKLKKLSHQELLDLFKTLPSAEFEEMDGEYDTTMLAYPTERGRKMAEWTLYETGISYWLGKAFNPSSENPEFRGEGYNRFRVEGKEIHHTRFASDMSESMIDGKLVFRMRYAPFKNFSGSGDMIDEVRFLQEGLYLCIGTYLPQKLPPDLFCLSGPVNEYNQNSEWAYGDEIKKRAKVPFTMDNYPFPEELKKK